MAAVCLSGKGARKREDKRRCNCRIEARMLAIDKREPSHVRILGISTSKVEGPGDAIVGFARPCIPEPGFHLYDGEAPETRADTTFAASAGRVCLGTAKSLTASNGCRWYGRVPAHRCRPRRRPGPLNARALCRHQPTLIPAWMKLYDAVLHADCAGNDKIDAVKFSATRATPMIQQHADMLKKLASNAQRATH